ncbi:SCP1.201-like deaminase [Saccharothrix longispora]
MASTGEVAAQVRAACAKGGQARTALEQAEDLAQEAHGILARALEGARHLGADGEQVLAAFTRVVDACKGHYWPLLNEAVKAAESYAARLAAEGMPDPASTAQRPAQSPAQPSRRSSARQAESDDPLVIPNERIEALRQELPPPVVRGSGQKTHGRWIGPDGTVRDIVSGEDSRTDLVNAQLVAKGWEDGTTRDSDIEMKLAAHMVENEVRHATVIINNAPCKGRLSCDTLVPILLPKGATLTVHGVTPTGIRTRIRYTGGAEPWWL